MILFNPHNRPVTLYIKPKNYVEIGLARTWDGDSIDHVERHFGVAREHIDTFFQLPATIEGSDTGVTFLITQEDECMLDVFLRNLPKNHVIE